MVLPLRRTLVLNLFKRAVTFPKFKTLEKLEDYSFKIKFITPPSPISPGFSAYPRHNFLQRLHNSSVIVKV
jgi:hypothetical protein